MFLKILERSDTLAKKLLVNLSKEFSVWINKATLFSQYKVKERVALSLLILDKVYSKDGSKKAVISINRDDFASYVGTAKETLVRMLRYFKDEGIIASSRTNITILKPRLLMNMVEDM
jgi:CRP-like cAMP-binding protein